MTQKTLTLTEAEALADAALRGAGTTDFASASLSKAVAAAERDGIVSHGLVYVPNYCLHVQCGKVIGTAEPTLEQRKPSVIHVDAANGFAHPAIDKGFEALIPLARTQGCAILTINNSYNCGVLGYHAERLAQAGLIGLCFTNAPASIAPYGGKKAVIGTNPFALAVPDGTGEAAFVIDQSASVIAKSEVMMHAKQNKDIPEGWALDAAGQPTTDPHEALKGTMLPTGNYKGFSAGMMVELFAAALSGAYLGIDASPFSGTEGGPPKTGQCFIAIDADSCSGDDFYHRVKHLCAAIEAQEGARLPGEKRKSNRARTEKEGVTLSEELYQKIQGFCA